MKVHFKEIYEIDNRITISVRELISFMKDIRLSDEFNNSEKEIAKKIQNVFQQIEDK